LTVDALVAAEEGEENRRARQSDLPGDRPPKTRDRSRGGHIPGRPQQVSDQGHVHADRGHRDGMVVGLLVTLEALGA